MNYINHEESGYGIDLDLLTISYESRVSNPRTNGLIEDVTIQGPSTLWTIELITKSSNLGTDSHFSLLK